VSGQSCPFCGADIHPNPRYPNRLCRTCIGRAQSADGRPLRFLNESFSGGFIARYADTDEEHPGHDCYVDGKLCRADEEYMGTIVVIPVSKGDA
jgi:hypothetical protein